MVSNSLLLDACVAINLLATGRIQAIAIALDIRFLMARQAAAECGELDETKEVKSVLARGASAGEPPFAEVLTLVDVELDAYIELARDIDDGEAATIAIARSRSIPMATDDRKARRVAIESGVASPTGTTSLLRRYVEEESLTLEETSVILQCVRDLASYVPRQSDESYGWWENAIRS